MTASCGGLASLPAAAAGQATPPSLHAGERSAVTQRFHKDWHRYFPWARRTYAQAICKKYELIRLILRNPRKYFRQGICAGAGIFFALPLRRSVPGSGRAYVPSASSRMRPAEAGALPCAQRQDERGRRAADKEEGRSAVCRGSPERQGEAGARRSRGGRRRDRHKAGRPASVPRISGRNGGAGVARALSGCNAWRFTPGGLSFRAERALPLGSGRAASCRRPANCLFQRQHA